MWLINGAEQTYVAADDRAVQFGDGCFTTARVVNGKVRFLNHHLDRLEEGCRRLGIATPERERLHTESERLACGHARAVLKIILTRGSGGRGYSAETGTEPNRLLRISAYPAHYDEIRLRGAVLAHSPVPLGRNPWLAGIKHLNRLEQVLIRAQLDHLAADEALVLDTDGWLTECCAANLFWRTGKAVYTPKLDAAGVDGTMRRHILAILAASTWEVSEVHASPEALAQADEVIICNALMPVLPVRQAAQWRYSSRELYRYLAPQCE
ncbi:MULTISPECIES: aminodeoxychorismate lyase [Tenebrionibacter/Tenebrionicola group]|jgi:4-amino-4-deoxychorismate lyase|uniref:Aminodeoxychorismate lyase n=2 Tax=Tenebrionibacter/Tenebrionicola group TaxID=2969848 RepID=A0A8K0V780_9ENTR|nr:MULTISPECIES: aminodeoxychorismate lyase [Tenebrionibacter/Tenebrionicola group]MBK4716375.1 aminodeoxychorismate lyase [Tenebrionibacter intestinalis]MBV5097152.1 aminodeoxychorismate lyase [Tenebrionicola larvae]